MRATARGNRAREAKEQFVCQRPTQASAPSAMPSGDSGRSYFESRRRQPTGKHRTSTFSQNENMPSEQGGNTLWLRSLPYPFTTFFRSWKKPIGTSDNGHYGNQPAVKFLAAFQTPWLMISPGKRWFL